MKTKDHYSEADLLETYYTQPGEAMPVMMHLADCADCAARYERIERKVRGLSACAHDDKPDTFWVRQRMTVMRRVAQQGRTSAFARVTRVAAAAFLALVLGGVIVSNRETVQPVTTTQPIVHTATTLTTAPVVVNSKTDDSTDPWASDELKGFGSMVEWESWVENGDQSL